MIINTLIKYIYVVNNMFINMQYLYFYQYITLMVLCLFVNIFIDALIFMNQLQDSFHYFWKIRNLIKYILLISYIDHIFSSLHYVWKPMTDLDSTQNNLKVKLPSDLKTKSNMVSSMILKIFLLIDVYFNFQNYFLC